MKKICKKSGREFEITDEDLKFYEKMKVPPPTLCPEERQRRRLAWRNERTLYKAKCGLCGQSMISLFPADTPYTVYCQSCWWSDKWNAADYARDYDFNRSFFEQFGEMLKEVPMFGLVNDYQSLHNCEYVNYLTDAKNCYLTFAANFLEDCLYCSYIWESKDCIDCCYNTGLTLCYECIDCNNCYGCWYLQNSKGCSDCFYGNGLENCSDCYGCVNLVNKKFCFFNDQLTEEEYRKRVKEEANIDSDLQKFQEFSLKFPRRYARLINCENSTGDVLKNCKNCHDCYEGYDGEDLKWVTNFPGKMKDCYDISGTMQTELTVDSAVVLAYEIRYSNVVLNQSHDINCSFAVDASHHLFGCIGMKKSKYCIFNKQYSKDEYEKMIPQIIKHMGPEWGEFFPAELSPFAYNETVAHEYYPLTKDKAIKKGYGWKNPDNEIEKKEGDNIRVCDDCGKDFLISKKERDAYIKISLVVPNKCHDCRHKDRIARRPMRRLWKSKCDKCSAEISTVYPPDGPEIVYCGECFRKELY